MHADIIICEDIKLTSIILHLAKNKKTKESVSKILSESVSGEGNTIVYEGEVIDCENDSYVLGLGEVVESTNQQGSTYNELVRKRISELKELEKTLLKESGKSKNVLEGEY